MRSTGILSIAVLLACSAAPQVQDPALARLEDWRFKQKQQECPAVPQDEAAKWLVRDGQLGVRKVAVYGPPDPYRRRPEAFLQHLWSRPNKLGEGVLVTATVDGKNDMANRTRNRAGWLVLDEKIYPLNVDAAQAFGRLYDSPKGAERKRLGLPTDYFTMESAFGIEDRILFRWHGSENPLPTCP